METVLSTKISGIKKLFSGKVRDVYKVDENHLMIVSTDRISAFDWVFPNGIPGKGIILNTISNMWFKKIPFINNHIVETDFNNFPKPFSNHPEFFKDRAVLIKRAKRIDFECVARGYIIGSGWKDYQQTGRICGLELPKGLQLAQELPYPLFTPASKADSGHDENISIDEMKKNLGTDVAEKLAQTTLDMYDFARDKLKKTGIILADTKFEFGFWNKEIILIDEVLTPDSSRFWDASVYAVGSSPASLDKQFIRDYLETTSWDKNSPPPPLPNEIIMKTKEKYEEILKRIKQILS